MGSQGPGDTGKGDSGTEQHPEEGKVCVEGQGPGDTGKDNA